MDEHTFERFGPPPERERRERPNRIAVNRWGDTLADQKRRRLELVEAMREVADGLREAA